MLYILPFQRDRNSTSKDYQRQGRGNFNCPILPTQHWFPRLLQMICEDSYLLPNTPGLLTMPNNPSKYHPLRKMQLGAFRVLVNHSKIEAYQMTLKPFYYLHGENRLKNNLGHISENGCHFVVKGKLMYLKQM